MRGRRRDAQGQQRAVQVTVARKRRLAATKPPEPVASPDQAPKTHAVAVGLVNDQVLLYQAEVARRAQVLEQDPSFRWPGEDEPLMMLSGSPPIPPPTEKAATPSPWPTPDTPSAEVLTAGGTLKMGDAEVMSPGGAAFGGAGNLAVQTAILPLLN
jgi:hypothetical protein